MDAERLIDIGRKLARPVTRLVASAHANAQPVGAWVADDAGRPARLRVDVAAHPDPACRRPGSLDLRVDEGEGEARLVRTRAARGDEVPLHGIAASDPPCIDVLFLRGGDAIRAWLVAHAWKPEWGYSAGFPGAAVVREYESWWWRETAWRADGVVAQLGGWPITWPDEPAAGQLRDPLVLRTYAGAEPWIEVLWRRPVYVVRARGT